MSRRLPTPSRPETPKANRFLSQPKPSRRSREFVYLLLDAARSPKIIGTIPSLSSACMCLYSGESKETLADVAPYLVTVDPTGDVFKWFIDEGWGDSWGIVVTSAAPIEDVRKHFRKFLLVHDEEDKTLYFRFYDPRVIDVFLESCTPEESTEFFGPISRFVFEQSSGLGKVVRLRSTAYTEKSDLSKRDLVDYLLGATSR